MPNAKVLSEKQAVVAALAERIRNAGSGVLVDYRGITVAQDTTLRSELRKNDVQYSVIKNTLTRLALDSLGLDALDGVLHGTTSLATSNGDPIAPFRVITDFAKKMPANSFQIKAAFMDGQVLSEDEIARIAALPSKDALYAQVFGTLLAPITAWRWCSTRSWSRRTAVPWRPKPQRDKLHPNPCGQTRRTQTTH